MSTPSTPQPGWYPDPTGSGQQRYFDGSAWTDQIHAAPPRLSRRPPVRPLPAAAPVTVAPAPSPHPAVASAQPAGPRLQRRVTAPVSPLSAQALLIGTTPMPEGPRSAGPARVSAPVPAGWYPDPARGGGLRFFDGVKWTARTRPVPHRARQLPVPAAVVAARLLAAQDAAAVRRAHDPVRPELIRVSKPQPAPSLAYHRTRSGSLSGMVATLTMILGLAACGYFSWNLWGSDYYTRYEQHRLMQRIEAQLHTPPPAATPSTPAATSAPRPPVPAMPADHSGPVGRIRIPKIGLDMAFVAGTDEEDLKQGPGLWLAGAYPGTPGNTTISAHRTTYGHAFRHLDQLNVGDQILIDVPGQPEAVYQVRGTTIASPFAVSVTRQVPGARLTMTTCNPVGSDKQRLVVESELVSGAWADHAVDAAHWQLLH